MKNRESKYFHLPFSLSLGERESQSAGGFTIIELLVAMGIFLIVIAIAIGGFVQALRTERQTTALLNANNNMSLVMEQMMREIRTGYNFCDQGLQTSCGQNNGQILSFINAQSQQVVYALGSAINQTSSVIYRSDDGGNSYQPLTAPDVKVDSLNFNYGGSSCSNPDNDYTHCRTGSNRPNFVTFSIGISPNDLPGITVYLQTSVSSRIL